MDPILDHRFHESQILEGMISRTIHSGIRAGLSPFKFFVVNLQLESLDPLKKQAVASIPGHPYLTHKVPIDWDVLLEMEELDLAEYLANEFLTHYRYRPRMEPEPNIELGEN